MQTRKQRRAEQKHSPEKIKGISNASGWGGMDLAAAGLILLFALTEFIPESGGGEVMGAQWIYLNVLNIIACVFILLQKKAVDGAAGEVIFRRLPAYFLFSVLALGVISVFIALNRTETMVNLARLLNTVILFCNFGLLLYGRPRLFALLAKIFSLILLIQSATTISAFFKGMEDADINKLIYSLKGNAGNKNILAASMTIKIPFVIYCIYTFTNGKRYLYLLPILTGTFAVFILNARSSYLGLILALVIFMVACTYLQFKHSVKKVVQTLLLILIPTFLSFFLSGAVIRNAIENQGLATPYGTVVDRLNSISLTAEGSNSRLQMWGSAVEHIKKNPFIGCGYGNWKLASIPYEKTYADEFLVAYHAHNDFLEITTELGIVGGLAYFLIFVFLGIALLRKLFSTSVASDVRIKAAVILMALAVYFTDAFLNFPLERPVMQFYFAWILATGLIIAAPEKAISSTVPAEKSRLIIMILFLLLLLPSLYITYTTYKSFVVQKTVNGELKQGLLQTNAEEVINAFPSIPNINGFCYPIDIIKGIYLVEAKQYERAIAFLDKGTKVNPYLPIAEFYKARIFLETQRPDSALPYAQKVFLTRPRSKAAYELLNDVCVQRKDTIGLDKAFKEFTRYRNEAWAWNRYIALRASLNTGADDLSKLVDSALQYFPDDPELLQKKTLLQPESNTHVTTAAKETEYQKSFAAGLDLYAKKNYEEAILNFTKAHSLNQTNYQALENTGLCYYASGIYNKAIEYFDLVLAQYRPVDGKSEYLKAISLLNLGKKDEACIFLQKAVAKGHPQAAEQAAISCK